MKMKSLHFWMAYLNTGTMLVLWGGKRKLPLLGYERCSHLSSSVCQSRKDIDPHRLPLLPFQFITLLPHCSLVFSHILVNCGGSWAFHDFSFLRFAKLYWLQMHGIWRVQSNRNFNPLNDFWKYMSYFCFRFGAKESMTKKLQNGF